MWDTLITYDASRLPNAHPAQSRPACITAKQSATLSTVVQRRFFNVMLEHSDTAKQSAQSEAAMSIASSIPTVALRFENLPVSD